MPSMAAPSFLSSFALLLALCSGHVAAQNKSAPAITHDLGCVHLPIVHSTNVNHFSDKRGVQLKLANRSDVAYYAQLSIGTPPQPVYVQLDTGSFELWVNPDCATVSDGDSLFCERAGRYDSAKSSTASKLGTKKTLRYGIGTANISYVVDTVSLAGSAMGLEKVQFGVATGTEDHFSGILGIGYGVDVATPYRNFVDELQTQNVTKVKAYTLALGSKESKEGVIVFGGVDTSKFGGPLAKLPIIPATQSPDQVPRFWVNMKNISITPPNQNTQVYTNSSMPVFLDSGSTMTLLPPNLTRAIAKDFGVDGPDANGFFRIDCGLTNVNGSLNFAFEGLNVRVPYKELIREVPGSPPACFLGITPSSNFALLGDTFLRSAYVVFDLEDNQIWMTQAANCGSTPMALRNMQDLGSLVGACGTTVSAVVTTSTSVTSPLNNANPTVDVSDTSQSGAPSTGGRTQGAPSSFGARSIPGGGSVFWSIASIWTAATMAGKFI
ncbi:aspartic peptidase domain-containing protein [Podospora didyma]|uniref:Aspartic peptidase domain-containing protein n=1 Tax=Podospora didyma TaxID=330526 RepID=A0AAE0KE06_9PEZI|nr:aspartic peptidase domain-containing protein [Podospora didyma]